MRAPEHATHADRVEILGDVQEAEHIVDPPAGQPRLNVYCWECDVGWTVEV